MKIQYCPNCLEYYGGGYFKRLEDYKCLYCENKIIDLNIETEEFEILWEVSQDNSFLESMIELKEKDPIEFQLKMQQFRTQTAQQKQIKEQESSKPKCPHCHSTNIKAISNLNRGASIAMWGIFSKKINKSFECLNCKYTW